MSGFEVKTRTCFRWLLAAAFCFACVSMLFGGSKAYAEGEELSVVPNQGYTYDTSAGELHITQAGTYEISLLNVDTSSHQINVDVDGVTLILNNIKLNIPEDKPAIQFESSTNTTLDMVGENQVESKVTNTGVIAAKTFEATNIVFQSSQGTGKLTVIGKYSNTRSIGASNITVKSGRLITEGDGIMCHNFTIEGGELSMTSNNGTGSDGVYVLNKYVQTGGKVDIVCYRYGIYVDGVAPYDAKDGVIVSGGELKIESKRPTGSSVTNCAIFAGYRNTKDIKISGTSKVELTTNYLGIGLIDSRSSLYMQGEKLSIEGAVQGIYTQSTWNGNIEFSGGETEIVSTSCGVSLGGHDKQLSFDNNYTHKNYDGDSYDGRMLVGDDSILSNQTMSSGNKYSRSKKYVLITPVYSISYDYDGGSLDEGVTNPDKYTKVDLPIVLNNPVKGDKPFKGWTGTGLDTMTKTVVIPANSTGAREYTAHFEGDDPEPPKTTSGILLARMVAKGSNKLRIDWTKIAGADGYDIFFAPCNSKTEKYAPKLVKTVKGNSTSVLTRSGLKKKSTYKCRVKAFVMQDGKKQYVSSSLVIHACTSGATKQATNPKSVKVKKTKVSLKKGKTYKIKASVTKVKRNKKLLPQTHAPKLRYLSSNKNVATVSGAGKIKGAGKGSCTVYAIAVNGVRKAIKVTVK